MLFPLEVETLFYRDAGRDYAIDEHTLSGTQWYYVLRGDVETVVDGKPLRLGPHSSVVIPAGIRRAPRCVGQAPSYIVAIFKSDGLELEEIAYRVLAMPVELRPDLLSLVAELRRPGGSDSELYMNTLLLRLLIGLRRALQPEPKRGPALEASVVARVEAFLQTNLHRPLTREDVAKAVHLSPPHIARVYRNASGKTLGRRLSELRVERAKQLLLGSTLPITEVAAEVGLSSFSHFTKLFRKEVGLVPSAFRSRGIRSK